MKVLILGGTAFFGKEIARAFHEAGHQVTLFTRGNVVPTDLPAMQHIKGDRNRAADLARAASAEWDCVIDNIAYDADSVRIAVEMFKKAKRYILTSSVSVYRYTRDKFNQPLRENTVDFALVPTAEDLNDFHWKYARGKLEAERVVVTQDKLPWTIIRPPVMYGPADPTERGYWYLGRLLQGGPILLGNGGVHSFRLAYSKDVGKAYVQAASKDTTIGHAYNITQDEVITLRDFIEVSALALGATPEFVDVPTSLLGDLAGPYGNMANFIPDNSAAKRDFGFQSTPWVEFASMTARWFRENWKGNQAKLFESRPREVEFVNRWKTVMQQFHAPQATQAPRPQPVPQAAAPAPTPAQPVQTTATTAPAPVPTPEKKAA